MSLNEDSVIAPLKNKIETNVCSSCKNKLDLTTYYCPSCLITISSTSDYTKNWNIVLK